MQDTVTKDRELFLGGSDIAAIMGISPFTSRLELLQYKAQIKENTFEGSVYTEWGNDMEGKIRDYVNTLGYDFIEDKIILDDSDVLETRVHADGVDHEQEVVLEVKTTSQIHGTVDGYKKYLVQLLYGMWAFGYDEGVLAVYERPKDLDMTFDKDRLQVFFIGMEDYEKLMKDILTEVAKFRLDYQYLCENPFTDDSELPSRSALLPVSEQIAKLENDIAWAKEITEQYDKCKKELCKAMREHNIKSWTMPNGTKVTYVPRGEDKPYTAFDEESFQKDHEDLYKEYSIEKTRKGKADYVRITPMAKKE